MYLISLNGGDLTITGVLTNRNTITLAEELEVARIYQRIEELRLGERLRCARLSGHVGRAFGDVDGEVPAVELLADAGTEPGAAPLGT